MPRLKNPVPIEPDLLEIPTPAPLAIPSPRREHEYHIDPYKALPGAIPQQDEPKKRKRGRPRKDDALAEATRESRDRLERYERYLDALQAAGGDIDLALSIVYRLPNVQEAATRRAELLADVQSGIPGSSTSEILQRQDMSIIARATVIRKWMYSANPAASLKAVDMANELDGKGPDVGSYEVFVRRVLDQ
jgi:hypothetical protein